MMKPSEFQTTIENQFDYICKVAMENERKDYLKALSRQCMILSILVDTFISKISFPMQPSPEIGSISDA